MKLLNPLVLIAVAAMALPCGVAHAAETGSAAAAHRVVEQFHAALQQGDATQASALMAPTAVVYESGYAETRAEYLAHHLAADMAFAKATRRVVKASQHQCSESLCVLMQTSETTGQFKGKDVRSLGVETTVLQRDGDTWKIHHVHWSSRK